MRIVVVLNVIETHFIKIQFDRKQMDLLREKETTLAP